MGLNGFTEWLFSALLSWMQIIYNWFWSMLASGGQNEFMPWFSDNWLKIVAILLVIGLVVDYTIYLMRWQPYHVWLTALRRAKGYVSRPFAKEQHKLHYAGYKRVLEGYEGDDDDYDARSPRRRVAARGASDARNEGTRVYAAQPAEHAAHRVAAVEARPADARASGSVHAPDRSVYARPTTDDGFETETVRVAAAVKPEHAALGHADGVDAEGYEPERVAAPMQPNDGPDGEQMLNVPNKAAEFSNDDMFSEPPAFARSTRESAPVYGRIHQGPGQQFMPVGMEADTRPQFELPDMELPEFDDVAVAEPMQSVKPDVSTHRPQGGSAVRVQRTDSAARMDSTARTNASAARPVAARPAAPVRTVQNDGMPRRPVRSDAVRVQQSRPAQSAVGASRTRQYEATAKSAPQPRYEGRPAVGSRPQQYQAAVRSADGVYQTGQKTGTPSTRRYDAAPAADTAAPRAAAVRPAPRAISVHESGSTREMDYDDEID